MKIQEYKSVADYLFLHYLQPHNTRSFPILDSINFPGKNCQ